MHTKLLGTASFASLLSASRPRGTSLPAAIGIALSGGPDSTALAYLLDKHIRRSSPGASTRLQALVVNHGLRQGSGEEAHKVASWALRRGISAEVREVQWGRKGFPSFPVSGSVEGAARLARLILYKRFMKDHGIMELYLAHHNDDLYETAYLRQARGTAIASALPGLRPYTILPLVPRATQPSDEKLRLVRPLLGVRKKVLLQLCEDNGLPYVQDPTNLDPGYTSRNAFRDKLARLQSRFSSSHEGSGPVHHFCQWSKRLQDHQDRLKFQVSSLMQASGLMLSSQGMCAFEAVAVGRASPEVRRAFLANVARLVYPAGTGIAPASLRNLDTVLFSTAIPRSRGHSKVQTPGGKVIFRKHKSKGVLLYTVARQPLRAIESELLSREIHCDTWLLWDDRFWLRYRSRGRERLETLDIRPHGRYVLPALYKDDVEVWSADMSGQSLKQLAFEVECRLARRETPSLATSVGASSTIVRKL